MINIIMGVLIGAFLCWFIRAVYIHTMEMEYVYHWDEYHAQEKEE